MPPLTVDRVTPRARGEDDARSVHRGRLARAPRAVAHALGADGRLAREIWGLAWPAITHMLLLTLVAVASRVIVGRHSTLSMAALQLGATVQWTLYSLLTAHAAGTVAVVAREKGARDEATALAAARSSLGLTLAVGVAVGGLAATFADPLMAALFPTTEEAVRSLAADYVRVTSAALPFALLEAVGAAALQAAGNTRLPLLVAGFGNVVHVVLAYGLVFGRLGLPELGLRGAALGASSTMVLEGLILGGIVLAGRGPFAAAREAPPSHDARRGPLARVLTVSGPAFAERLVYHAGYTAFVAILATLGGTALAANQALVTVEAVSFLSADGFAIAASAVVAQRLGASEPARARAAGWLGAGLATVALSLFGIGFVLAPRWLLSLFTTEPAVVELATGTVLVATLAQPFMGYATVLAAALRGAGDTRSVLFAATVGSLVRVAVTAALAGPLGLLGVWLGSGADWVVRAVVLTVAFVRGRWTTALA